MLRKLSLPVVALVLLWVVGCSKSSNSITDTPSTDISAQFGGYTTSNELPGFGDATLSAESEGEVTVEDSYANSALVDSVLRDPNAGFYHLRVTWGHLRYDSTETDWTNWNGSLTLSYGAEVVRRIIKFEDGDSLLPRTSRGLIEWASKTREHYDGLAVDLFVPRQVPTIDSLVTITVDSLGDTVRTVVYDTLPTVPVTLSFQTGPYSRTFSFRELVALDTIVTLDDSNSVSFTAVRLDHFPCPRGFLAGLWGYDTTGLGVFKGIWIAKSGLIDGSFEGTFGVNDSGKQVFYGKWIDTDGRFEGLLRGYWGDIPRPDHRTRAYRWAGGWFLGGIYNGDATLIGVMGGKYRSSADGTQGFMQGRWKIGCPDFDTDNNNDGFCDGNGKKFEDHPEDYGASVKARGEGGN